MEGEISVTCNQNIDRGNKRNTNMTILAWTARPDSVYLVGKSWKCILLCIYIQYILFITQAFVNSSK